jgi:hypothetical protein
MKLTNTLATIALAAFMVVGLSACGKKKNGSNNAATPGSACIFNAQTGTYTNTAGQYCNPNATQTTCPATGVYTTPYGYQQSCTPGQVINNTQYGNGYVYPGQYQYPNYQNQSGCDSYYYQYGIQYVPVVLNNQLQCMRIDLLNQYTQGTQYYNNYDYYYAYPPYQYQQGSYCGTQVAVSFSGFSGAMCF